MNENARKGSTLGSLFEELGETKELREATRKKLMQHVSIFTTDAVTMKRGEGHVGIGLHPDSKHGAGIVVTMTDAQSMDFGRALRELSPGESIAVKFGSGPLRVTRVSADRDGYVFEQAILDGEMMTAALVTSTAVLMMIALLEGERAAAFL